MVIMHEMTMLRMLGNKKQKFVQYAVGSLFATREVNSDTRWNLVGFVAQLHGSKTQDNPSKVIRCGNLNEE
jgi:hypothetical protein